MINHNQYISCKIKYQESCLLEQQFILFIYTLKEKKNSSISTLKKNQSSANKSCSYSKFAILLCAYQKEHIHTVREARVYIDCRSDSCFVAFYT